MSTGCRIEELCSLRVSDLVDDRFTVGDAKSEAGWREVPVHDLLSDELIRLSNASTDGFVLSELTKNKFGDRSNAVGKRFGRMKRKLGFGPDYVFHSIRRTVTTQLENAGVPEAVSADIVGHKKTTMTYELYSGGTSFERKRQAIQRLTYPLGTG